MKLIFFFSHLFYSFNILHYKYFKCMHTGYQQLAANENVTLDFHFTSVLQTDYKNWCLYCSVNKSGRKKYIYKNSNLHINVKWLDKNQNFR